MAFTVPSSQYPDHVGFYQFAFPAIIQYVPLISVPPSEVGSKSRLIVDEASIGYGTAASGANLIGLVKTASGVEPASGTAVTSTFDVNTALLAGLVMNPLTVVKTADANVLGPGETLWLAGSTTDYPTGVHVRVAAREDRAG